MEQPKETLGQQVQVQEKTETMQKVVLGVGMLCAFFMLINFTILFNAGIQGINKQFIQKHYSAAIGNPSKKLKLDAVPAFNKVNMAGIKVTIYNYPTIPFPQLLDIIINKINNLLIAHPNTDIIVTPEFFFSGGGAVYLTNQQGVYTVSGAEPANPNNQLLVEKINEIRGIAAAHRTNFSLGTVNEKDQISPSNIYNTVLIINQNGDIIGIKRKFDPLTTQKFSLLTHENREFTILPIICGEGPMADIINAATGFKADILTHSVSEGDFQHDQVSSYYQNGLSNNITLSEVVYEDSYNNIYLENYLIGRDAIKEDGFYVSSDNVGGLAGVMSLQRKKLNFLELTADYVYGEGYIPSDTHNTSISNGFSNRYNDYINSFYQYNSDLYALTYNADGGEIWKTADGQHWQKVIHNGFGTPENYSITSMIEYNNYLYVATKSIRNFSSANLFSRADLWRFDGNNWVNLTNDGFGNNSVYEFTSFAVLNNELYVAGKQWGAWGAKIWKTANGTDWSLVGQNGFNNYFSYQFLSLAVFDNYLYASTFGFNGTEIWRTSDGNSWQKVNQNGFGDSLNIKTYSLFPYGGYFYAGTFNANGGEVWRTSNGTDWQLANANGFGNPRNYGILTFSQFNNYLYASTYNYDGAEIWRSADGNNWVKVNTNGFGDLLNRKILSLSVYNNNLYASTWNPDGAEIWRSADGENWDIINPDIN